MTPLSLSSVSSHIKGLRYGPDVSFERVSTDTRTLQPGDLYVALVGESFDGNEFTMEAFDKGACAAIVSATVDHALSHLRVEDTTVALGEIARMNRLASPATVVAITGSQGKTTVKEMTGSILGVSRRVLTTRGNFNNHVGAPLTLLELGAEHDCAVIELGASGLGEIAYTVRLTLPHVAVITNAAATHIEGFGDLQGVVRTKGEIIDGLDEDGVAVLNAGDSNTPAWRARAGRRKVVTFGLQNADYQASDIRTDTDGTMSFLLSTPRGEVRIQINLPGMHNVINATAAAAAALEAGATLADVAAGLRQARPVPGRLNVLDGQGGCVLIDDSYNASPASFKAAIEVLRGYAGTRVLVMGDMGELGADCDRAHAGVGDEARAAGIEQLWTVGAESELAARSFGQGAMHFADQDALVAYARPLLAAGMVLLVKGSRSAGMDKVVAKLKSGDPA